MKQKTREYKKCYLFIVIFLLTIVTVFAQSTDSSTQATAIEEQIVLPEVTTDLDVENKIIETAAIPDFTQVLPENSNGNADLPVLSDGSDIDAVADLIIQKTDENEIAPLYLEGIIGGGYPGFFIGNFNIYQSTGKNPFSLVFNHEAVNGYGRHEASQGYNDSQTVLIGTKQQTLTDKIILEGTAEYNTSTVGLQSQSPLFYNISRQYIGFDGSMDMQVNDNFSFSTGIDASYINRFAGYTSEVADEVLADDVLTGGNLISVSPIIGASFTHGNFSIDLDGSYRFVSLDSSVDSNDDVIHKMALSTLFSYSFSDAIAANGGVGISYIASDDSSFVVPFNVELDVHESFFTMDIEGGLQSELTDIASLQEKYPYAHFETIPTEESFWYGVIDTHIPFLQTYAVNMSADFRKTALDNQTLWPDYSKEDSSGMYSSSYSTVTELITALSVSTQFNNWGIDAGWNANWLDKILGTNTHEVFTNISYTASNAKSGVQLLFLQPILDLEVPEIGCSAFYHFAQSFQVELSLQDMVLLFTGEDRLIAGDYCSQGGSISLNMKVFF